MDPAAGYHELGHRLISPPGAHTGHTDYEPTVQCGPDMLNRLLVMGLP